MANVNNVNNVKEITVEELQEVSPTGTSCNNNSEVQEFNKAKLLSLIEADSNKLALEEADKYQSLEGVKQRLFQEIKNWLRSKLGFKTQEGFKTLASSHLSKADIVKALSHNGSKSSIDSLESLIEAIQLMTESEGDDLTFGLSPLYRKEEKGEILPEGRSVFREKSAKDVINELITFFTPIGDDPIEFINRGDYKSSLSMGYDYSPSTKVVIESRSLISYFSINSRVYKFASTSSLGRKKQTTTAASAILKLQGLASLATHTDASEAEAKAKAARAAKAKAKAKA